MNRTSCWYVPPWVLCFSAQPPAGPPSPPSSGSSGSAPPPVDGPAWKAVVQYLIASAFVLVFLGLLTLDPFLPDYDVPPLLYMVILVVIVFALPGSEKIATVLINAIFRRKDDP
jgi:hypothetical protein